MTGSRNSLRLMIYNITERVAELHRYYDEMLDAKIARIAELAGVGTDAFVKLNPADFIERNRFQRIDGYDYRNIGRWIGETKRDGVYLISPLDADEETANQIAYKEGHIEKKLRASRCEVIPLHKKQALAFFVKNHRQSLPPISERGVSFGLVYDGCLVSVMTYDVQAGAVRGRKTHYELLRLAIRHGYRVNGGASRLQKHCEDALSAMGETEVFSYSNATINNGAVYRQLGFSQKKVEGGQPFVMMRDNSLVRLINLYPDSTDSRLARAGRIKTHIGGNRLWTKKIGSVG